MRLSIKIRVTTTDSERSVQSCKSYHLQRRFLLISLIAWREDIRKLQSRTIQIGWGNIYWRKWKSKTEIILGERGRWKGREKWKRDENHGRNGVRERKRSEKEILIRRDEIDNFEHNRNWISQQECEGQIMDSRRNVVEGDEDDNLFCNSVQKKMPKILSYRTRLIVMPKVRGRRMSSLK